MVKVDLRQIMAILKSGEWVTDLRFIKADVAKNTGGTLVEIPKCRLARRQTNDMDNFLEKKTDINRPAQHNANFTVNVVMPNKEIRKLHPILITHLNNCQAI